jgi:hypothetical protein
MNLMNPQGELVLKTLESTLAPIPPTKSASRLWRIVLIVVAVQAFVVVLGGVAFAALGMGQDNMGTCGGG